MVSFSVLAKVLAIGQQKRPSLFSVGPLWLPWGQYQGHSTSSNHLHISNQIDFCMWHLKKLVLRTCAMYIKFDEI